MVVYAKKDKIIFVTLIYGENLKLQGEVNETMKIVWFYFFVMLQLSYFDENVHKHDMTVVELIVHWFYHQ